MTTDGIDVRQDSSGLMEVRLTGANAKPDAISVSELIKFLGGIEQTLHDIAQQSQPDLGGHFYISLVEVREGSALFRFKPSLRDAAISAAMMLSASAATGDFNDLPAAAVESYAKAVSYVRSQEWRAELKLSPEDQQPAIVIDHDTTVPEYRPTIIEGETTIYGEVERVGGQDPKVGVRLTEQGMKLLPCRVSRDLAKKLAERLYTIVGLRGVAKWQMPSLELVNFEVQEITEYEPSTFVAAMSELREVLGPHLSGVTDPQDYLRKLRADDA